MAVNTTLRHPAEWETHRAIWLAWPTHRNAWGPHLEAAQQQFIGLCEALVEGNEPIELCVSYDEGLRAEQALAHLKHGIRMHRINYGDVWLRDTGPIFVHTPQGLRAERFKFNGWGGKFIYEGDDRVSDAIAQAAQAESRANAFILEGGAIDSDGAGTFLTTQSCLLNPNRPPQVDQASINARLAHALGARKVIWIEQGLVNDHTDGHIDNIARFIAKGSVVCMHSSGANDPNAATLAEIERVLKTQTDADGAPLNVVTIPSPGAVIGSEGVPMAASYMNFYIGNRVVVMPAFGVPNDEPARAALAKLFPNHNVVARRAEHILEGGGTFHCISQQEPVAP
jgi:agmatine deiminase